MRRILAVSLLLGISISPAGAADPPITAAAFIPGEGALYVGSQAGVELRTWPDLKATGPTQRPLPHIHDLAYSPDGQRLLVAGGAPTEKGEVIVLDMRKRIELLRVGGHADLVYRVAWSPDGKEFATASGDGICQVFEATSGKLKSHFTGHSRGVLAIVYLPGGKTIVSAGVDHALQVWDATTGKAVRTLDNHLAAVNDLALRPTTNTDVPPSIVSISDDRTVRLWQPTIGRLLRFAKLTSQPRAVAWSTDGKQIIVGCSDGTLWRIDPDTVESRESEKKFDGRIHVLIRSPGDGFVVGGEGGMIKLD